VKNAHDLGSTVRTTATAAPGPDQQDLGSIAAQTPQGIATLAPRGLTDDPDAVDDVLDQDLAVSENKVRTCAHNAHDHMGTTPRIVGEMVELTDPIQFGS
jgi:hypothetical protein